MLVKYFFIILAAWLVIAIIGLFAAAISGRVKRAYPVSQPEYLLQINGVEKSLAEWAAFYRPIMKLRSTTPSPELLNVLYETIEGSETITFVYYHVWEDEIHPNPLYHRLYKFFRAAYYGYPVRDIEYIQLVVDRKTGEVLSLMFETSPGDDYFVNYSVHLIQRLTRDSSGLFTSEISERNGTKLSTTEKVRVLFEDHHAIVGAATWNHLTELVPENNTAYDIAMDSPIQFLSDEDFQSMKFVRKSQGDYKTVETGLNRALGMFGGFLFLTPLVIIMRAILLFQRKR